MLQRLLVILLISACYSLQAQDSLRQEFMERELSCYKQLMHFKAQSTQDFYYNITYQRCEWKIDPRIRYIKGNITTYFKPGFDNFKQIGFDFSHVLKIDSVVYHGIPLSYTVDGADKLLITLPFALANSQLDSIRVYYQGVPLAGSFMHDYHAGQPLITTLSEPYGAREWWPCKQSLDDKIDSLDVIVTTPKPNRCGSNGVLVSAADLDSLVRYHWKHRYPIATYLVAIGVTNYEADTDYVAWSLTDSFPVVNYFYPENATGLFTAAKQAVPIMKLYIKLVGRYPFDKEKYGHAQHNRSGGMEHQTMSFMVNMGFGLVAHEMAHQWFGDKVTCYSWSDIWLNEGFATYMEGLSEEFIRGKTDWENWKNGNLEAAMHTTDGSVFVPDTVNEGRIFSSQLSYSKGALLLHMLRFMMGDSMFFHGLRAYLSDPGLAYGFGRTAKLQKHMEQASGLSLTNFFNEWYKGQGFPIIKIRWFMDGQHLRIFLNQSTSHPSVSFFHIPIPVRIKSNGKDSTLVLHPESNEQSFDFLLPDFPVDSLEADPDRWVMARFEVLNSSGPAIDRIRVYPNPASDLLKLELVNTGNGDYVITDAMGRKCLEGRTAKIITIIDLHGLRKGLYCLQFKGKSGIYSKPFLIEK